MENYEIKDLRKRLSTYEGIKQVASGYVTRLLCFLTGTKQEDDE